MAGLRRLARQVLSLRAPSSRTTGTRLHRKRSSSAQPELTTRSQLRVSGAGCDTSFASCGGHRCSPNIAAKAIATLGCNGFELPDCRGRLRVHLGQRHELCEWPLLGHHQHKRHARHLQWRRPQQRQHRHQPRPAIRRSTRIRPTQMPPAVATQGAALTIIQHAASAGRHRPPPGRSTTRRSITACSGSGCTGPGGTPSYCTYAAANYSTNPTNPGIYCAYGASATPGDPTTWTGTITVGATSRRDVHRRDCHDLIVR